MKDKFFAILQERMRTLRNQINASVCGERNNMRLSEIVLIDTNYFDAVYDIGIELKYVKDKLDFARIVQRHMDTALNQSWTHEEILVDAQWNIVGVIDNFHASHVVARMGADGDSSTCGVKELIYRHLGYDRFSSAWSGGK